MKTLIILFAGSACEYSCKQVFDGKASYECALDFASTIPDVEQIVVLDSNATPKEISNATLSVEKLSFKHIYRENWTIESLFKTMQELSTGFEAVIFAFIDSPFYDIELTKELIQTHRQNGAEYTFADGYPIGVVPEILHTGILPLLASLSKDNQDAVARDVIFGLIKKDINSFEVETLISKKDWRCLRLTLACDTKRNTLQCERLFELKKYAPNESLGSLAETNPRVLRTLPSFYAMQIAVDCSGACNFCPYPQAAERAYGKKLGDCHLYMNFEQFAKLVKKIYDFSSDAVISLSLWGEALRHPHLTDFIQEVLKYPSLSLLIETTGENLTKEKIAQIAKIVNDAKPRTNGEMPLNWIVSLDAIDSERYRALHGVDAFTSAVESVFALNEAFPKAVYPQFLRMNENEDQLEAFFRTWKEKVGTVIIQKYDSFCGALKERKVADLSPVNRNPCWHLRRDMYILVDGSVPQCRESLLDGICGNAFSQDLSLVWEQNALRFAKQLERQYEGLCEHCDEYYTFNF